MDNGGQKQRSSIAHGYKKARRLTLTLANTFLEDCSKYDITVLVTLIDEQIKTMINEVKNLFLNVRKFEVKEVSTALAIHIGPESFGLAVSKVEIA